MKNRRLFILTGFLLIFLNGCSFLKIASAPFRSSPTKLPQETKKEEKYVKCKGDILFDELGNIKSCSDGFKTTEKLYNQSERKLTFKEKIKNFIDRLWGWGLWAIVASVIITFMGGGILVSNFWMSVFGVGNQTLKAISKGISKGKEYVRSNGTNYSPEERKIYHQGASDLLKHIEESTNDPKIIKYLYKLRGELKAQEK